MLATNWGLTVTRVIAQFVVRNEADKYLESCLKWNSQWWDDVHFYDDQSTDDTVKICSRYGKVDVRPDKVPSFVENEGKFRQAAWDRMGELLDVQPTDWIVSVDADEFLVGTVRNTNPYWGVHKLAESADNTGNDLVSLLVPEVWRHDFIPMVRTDGFWGRNFNPRMCRFDRPGKFRDGMGSGSVPAGRGNGWKGLQVVSLLHFGYTVPGAIQRKYDLYSGNPGRHNVKHIESIVAEPELREWTGEVPKCYIGQRSV